LALSLQSATSTSQLNAFELEVRLDGMNAPAFAHCVSVSLFQLTEDNCGQQCHSAKNVKRLMDATDKFKWIRLKACGQKEDGK
jgi:hypothetical protein